MKKNLAILLSLSLIISVLIVPVTVSADTTETVYYYNDFSSNSDSIVSVANGVFEVSDGCLVQTIVTDNDGNSSQGFKLDVSYTNTSADRQPLVLEYRVKFQPVTEYHQFAIHKNGNTYGANVRAAYKYMQFLNGEAYEKYYFDESVNLIDTWHTVSIVYSNTANTRDFYFDGNYMATSVDSGEAKENKWDEGTFTGVRFDLTDDNGSKMYMDYLKVYELPTDNFTASLKAAYDSSVVVEFNQVPGNIEKNMFTINDGTKISEVVKVSENMYKLVPETELTANTSYTLNISNTLKSSVGKAITTSSLSLTPASSLYVSEGTLPYFNAFETDGVIDSTGQLSGITSNITGTVENGYLKLLADGKSTGAAKNGSIYFNPEYTNTSADRQPLVFEYKLKFDAAGTISTTAYFTHHSNASKSPYGIQLYPKKEKTATGAYLPKVNFTSATATTYTLPGAITDWHTVSIVYSNVDNTKILYWDGKEIATSTNDTAVNANYWDDQGKLGNARLYISTPANWNFTAYMDSLKLYEKPSVFGAQVLDAEETELDVIYVDFNSTVSNINGGVLTVNGKAPLSIEEYDEEDQIYKVTLSEKLKPQTEYRLSLNGVANTVGQMAYNDITFTTRAPKDNEVIFNISGTGTVKDSEGDIKNGDFKEAESIALTVKPNKGYQAVVKVNEEVINEASYGLYNISVTNGAVIDIEFNEISSEVPQFTAPVCFVDEESPDTTYTFVRINMLLPETDFGVIVSSDSDKLDAEDVDSANTFMLPALNGSNAFGEYGIKIIDKAEGNVLGNTYYVRPYALFNGTYYYQNPVTVNVNTVQ